MTNVVEIDTRDITVTPIFKYSTVENVPASEREGHPVMTTHEMVEVRFAGSRNYSPEFPVHAFYKRDGHRVVTYAERWADQYRQFLEGRPQEANGTPLEMLKAYGITDSQLSLCRALKIHSIEAIDKLEGTNLKSLGMSANDIKAMVRKYMADRSSGSASRDEIDALKAEIAALRESMVIPEDEKPGLEKVDELVVEADQDSRKKALKDEIEAIVGTRPRGNPSVETLETMLSEMKATA